MKIIFKGYKGRNKFECLTIDGVYKAQPLGGGYYSIRDDEDMGMIIDIKNYNFEFIDEDNVIASHEAVLKYLINGNQVTKGYFYQCIGEIIEAKKLGVSCLVDFEIHFDN